MNHPVLRTAAALTRAAACPMASARAGLAIQAVDLRQTGFGRPGLCTIDLRDEFVPGDVTATPKPSGVKRSCPPS